MKVTQNTLKQVLYPAIPALLLLFAFLVYWNFEIIVNLFSKQNDSLVDTINPIVIAPDAPDENSEIKALSPNDAAAQTIPLQELRSLYMDAAERQTLAAIEGRFSEVSFPQDLKKYRDFIHAQIMQKPDSSRFWVGKADFALTDKNSPITIFLKLFDAEAPTQDSVENKYATDLCWSIGVFLSGKESVSGKMSCDAFMLREQKFYALLESNPENGFSEKVSHFAIEIPSELNKKTIGSILTASSHNWQEAAIQWTEETKEKFEAEEQAFTKR